MSMFLQYSKTGLLLVLLAYIPSPAMADKALSVKVGKQSQPTRKTMPVMALAPQTVTIPAGCFQMGSHAQELGRNKDELQHRVCVNSFKLGKFEISLDDFNKFITASQFKTDAERDVEELGCWGYEKDLENLWDWRPAVNWRHPIPGPISGKHPAACVSFNDVMAYIHWLNQQTGQEYRLPTEAEWEYAARAGTVTVRYWGNNPAFACHHANVADTSELAGFKWTERHDCGDGYFFSAPIASFLANKFGLHDMLGNVWEWTCSAYQENYAGEEFRCTQEANANGKELSIRGGGWNADPARIRSASRNSGLAWSRQANLGFRLVRVR